MIDNTSGVYAIKNLLNNKIYVGSSQSMRHRWEQQHRSALRKGTHFNNHLQRAWIKYGEDNFVFQVIEECEVRQFPNREGYWIDYYRAWDRQYGYNLTKIVKEKKIFTDEYRQRMSESKLSVAHEEIIKLFQQGKSKRSIAKQLKISRSAVYSVLEHHGLHANVGKGSVIKFTQKKKKEILRLRKQGMSWTEIIKQTGGSKTHLYRSGIAGDGKYRNKKVNRNAYRVMTKAIAETAKNLRKQGLLWKEISNRLNISVSSLYYHGLHKEV